MNSSEEIIATMMEPMLVHHTFTNCQYLFRSKILPDKEELEGTSVYEIDNKKWDLPELRPLE
jgi:hypothetical protein